MAKPVAQKSPSSPLQHIADEPGYFTSCLFELIDNSKKDPSVAILKKSYAKFHRDPTARRALVVAYLKGTTKINISDLSYLLNISKSGQDFPTLSHLSDVSSVMTEAARLNFINFILSLPDNPTSQHKPGEAGEALVHFLTLGYVKISMPNIQAWLQEKWPETSVFASPLGQEIAIALADHTARKMLLPNFWSKATARRTHLPLASLVSEATTRRLILKSAIPHLAPAELTLLCQSLAKATDLAPGRAGDLAVLFPALKKHLKAEPKILTPWLTSPHKPVREAGLATLARLRPRRPPRP